MGTPFLGEIKIVSFSPTFGPQGWAQCNGQFLPINQNQALFSILGTTFGGNGQTTFALPDFRGRVPVHRGSQNTLGQAGGQEVHTVTQAEMPQHTHFLQATNTDIAANRTAIPTGNHLGPVNNLYTNPSSPGVVLTTKEPTSVGNVGGSQPHENRQPFLALNFIIALQGIFPSHN